MKQFIFLALVCMPFALPAQNTGIKKSVAVKKINGPEASIISMTIEHNGQKTEINNKQFETWGGTSISAGAGKAIILNYGASNSKKNNDSFSWMFTIPKAEKGIYTVGDRAGEGPVTSLTFSTSAFPNIPMFMCKSGSIEIASCPSAGGFVTGTFSVVLTGGVTSDGQLDESEYQLSGSFSILRQ
jgi:hypothetical protein